jgi:hypothetical protein
MDTYKFNFVKYIRKILSGSRFKLLRIAGLSKRIIVRVSGLESFYFLGSKTVKATNEDWVSFVNCDGKHESVDVIVSIYNPKEFLHILISSINKNICSKITYILVFVDCDEFLVDQIRFKIDASCKVELIRFSHRVSIYRAWNEAILQGNSNLITNLNVDDLRRPGAICAAADFLGKDSTKEIVFGEVLVVKGLPLSEWEKPTLKIRKTNLKQFVINDLVFHGNNKPHCAPMWRRIIHREIGLFNPNLKSSGDSEFWLRCLLSGKRFINTNMVFAAYYLNPKGLSSGWRSAGFREWNKVLEDFYSKTS